MGKVQTIQAKLKVFFNNSSISFDRSRPKKLSQQTEKPLRRLLNEKSGSVDKETSDGADWLVDGMTSVAVVPLQVTYKDFQGAILSYA